MIHMKQPFIWFPCWSPHHELDDSGYPYAAISVGRDQVPLA